MSKRNTFLPLLALICVLALVAGWLLDRSGLGALGVQSPEPQQALRISEAQNNNVLTLTTAAGEASSWIEVENTGAEPVNLHGACLIRDTRVNKTFVFPDMTLPAGGFALVYCDGKSAANELHAPFRLPKSGNTALTLLDSAQNVLDSVTLGVTEADESQCRDARGEWVTSAQPTPGEANSTVSDRRMTVQSGELALNEAVTGNRALFPDEDGAYHDYIELRNRTDAPVNLAGYWLTDNVTRPYKWQFPDAVLPAGGCLAVHCSGLDRRDDPAHLHTNFKLSAGETVYLSRPDGAMISTVTLPELEYGQAYSWNGDGWTAALPPTPNMENTYDAFVRLDAEGQSKRAGGVYISEIMAEPENEKFDWIELYNSGDRDVNLSGWGISDRVSHPRKWQFPEGTVLPAGERTAIFLTGIAGGKTGGFMSAPFAIDGDGGYTMCLCDAEGALLDTLFVPQQYPGVAFGRDDSGNAGYFTEGTPLKSNGPRALKGPAPGAAYSVKGGLHASGDSFSVALTAEAGDIYYTLDCSDPTPSSARYDGTPIPVDKTTILRTRVYRDGYLPSVMDTQSYLYDVKAASDAPYVVSLVSDPTGLYSDETGIMVMGLHPTATFPYGDYNRGANFWMDWEREAHVEVFTGGGESALSQECGIKLHGRNTRAYELKCFKVMARGRYGDDKFRYPLFHNRPFNDYEAFILRYSGQDYKYAFMRDAVLTHLAANTSVMYMEAEECICYLNGEYYSAMYIRENISPYSLARREGWAGQEDALDLVKSGREVKQGSNASYAALKTFLETHDNASQEVYDRIAAEVDIDNFIEFIALQVFFGPPDTVNVKRYRNTDADGKWRWVIYDLDRAMRADINGFELMAQGTNAQLFNAFMANPALRDRFLTYLNKAMSTYLTSENILNAIEAQFERLKPLLPQYLEKLELTQSRYKSALNSFCDTVKRRPAVVLKSVAFALNLSQEEMDARFAETYAVMREFNRKNGLTEIDPESITFAPLG
ncbi:MAG: lamin tail domain-containing protein [Clostridia bacterium]|nr:lamin tail domain-containing protein [Clostridia bacterium]